MIDERLRGPYYRATLSEIRADVEARGPVAVAEDALTAINRINPELNAFVYVDPDDVRAQARALAEIDAADRGPLHGVPVAIKDLIDVAGYPITLGSKVYAERVAEQDAEGVRRLRAAGAIIVGITLTHEFAFGPTGDVSAYGAAHNPHDLTRMTGGSSGGSGAAVGAGLVPLALGTDTGGSIRIPAALCGAVGFKGAHGAVPTAGVFDLAPSMDHLGPIALDVEIARLGFEVLSGATVTPQTTFVARRQDISQVPYVDPRVAALVIDAAASLGASTGDDPVGLGDWARMRADAATVMTREAFVVHQDILDVHREDYQREVWERIDGGREIDEATFAAARAAGDELRSELQRRLGDDDVLVSPTVGITAPPIGERETVVEGASGATRAIVTNLTTRWNLLGFPAISVPCGDIDGLPVGLQLVAKPGSESALFAAAAAWEARRTR
ncbi:amidase [Epidermidibacterium keratini]|uniref:Amidase n=1 Tax=Epidermidibacterium keratini TaxID=1891644 RepID=A0A7L4YT99_9ACTN|nr:amidase [Epidermidibacterium keratini]QHC01999.1 amidase [Epidermidibacterium keratini]